MDLKDYDKLRKKINIKDFEGSNKALDKWLFGFSFVGNIGSIFFSYFLLYPALLKAITINLVTGFWGTAIAFIFTLVFLTIFEIIKRYLFRNFSSDYVKNNKKVNGAVFGWFTVSIAIVLLSFYLSLVGSKNLATTSVTQNTIATTQVDMQKDSLTVQYERKKKTYEADNQSLRNASNDLRNTLSQTPVGWLSIRRDYQSSIDKNTTIINSNQNEINKIDDQLKQRVNELKSSLNSTIVNNATEDTKNIILFIIIAIFSELIIMSGVYFREFYQHQMYILNKQKFEKIYQKKDRYKSLLMFIYNNGKSNVGDKVISGLELKELMIEKANIENSNKFTDSFLHDMDKIGIFNTVGKRRFIAISYQEALNIIDNYDDIYMILENIK
ncbi:MAG: hypothetical protein WC428_00250 [Candidatus Paceibacterota bacterium]|jgi:hypothetical protein